MVHITWVFKEILDYFQFLLMKYFNINVFKH
jgi:hypothetical protein